jgi:DnaK suppressor protein
MHISKDNIGILLDLLDHSQFTGGIMCKTDLKLLKATLEAKLAIIGTGSDKRADIVIQQAPDALDQTQYAAERDLTVSLLNRESQMSRRVKGALQRMEDSAYGICLSCEDPISPKRLQAVPWAELCLGCQTRADQRTAGILGADQDQGVEVEAA